MGQQVIDMLNSMKGDDIRMMAQKLSEEEQIRWVEEKKSTATQYCRILTALTHISVRHDRKGLRYHIGAPSKFFDMRL